MFESYFCILMCISRNFCFRANHAVFCQMKLVNPPLMGSRPVPVPGRIQTLGSVFRSEPQLERSWTGLEPMRFVLSSAIYNALLIALHWGGRPLD